MERYHHRRPIDLEFYNEVRASAATLGPARDLLPQAGAVIDCAPGDFLTVQVVRDPQVVLMYAWNPDDPDERLWCQETSGLEDCFLRTFSRVWSTMARFRAMLTLVIDSVAEHAAAPGAHHFVLDGWETSAIWRALGGDPAIPSAHERFASLLLARGVDPALHRDHLALFRKVVIEPETQRLSFARSDAAAGDRAVFFVEARLSVALVPSPYGAGDESPASLDGSIAPIRVSVAPSGVQPLGWPYEGVGYPDLTPYADPAGRRHA